MIFQSNNKAFFVPNFNGFVVGESFALYSSCRCKFKYNGKSFNRQIAHKILISNQVLVVLGKYLRFVVRVQNSKLKDRPQINL